MGAESYASDKARELFRIAESAALDLSHGYVGTEHVLLALIQLEYDLTNLVFNSLGVPPERIKKHILGILAASEKVSIKSRLPWTPRAKRVLEFAVGQARSFGDNQVFPEHVMLGLILERDGVASDVMTTLGLTYQGLCEEVMKYKK